MRCIVPSCRRDFNGGSSNYSKHAFPRNLARRNQWIKAIAFSERRAKLNANINFLNARICSDHFTADCFKPDREKNILHKTAIPTQFGSKTVDPENLSTLHIPKEPAPKEIPAEEPQIKTKRLLDEALRCVQRSATGKATTDSVFNLKKFPQVCRMCLQPNFCHAVMVSLNNTEDPVFGGKSIGDFIAAITSTEVIFDQDKKSHLPEAICLQCLELLKFFAKYRSKIVTAHFLMGALIELKQSNTGPILDLFNAKSNHVRALIKDLGLCNLDDYSVQDLLDEFPTYDLPSPEGVPKEEDKDQCLSEEIMPEMVHLETKTEVVFAVEGVVGDEDINEDSMDSPVETGDEQMTDTKKPPTKPKSKGKKFDEPLKCPKCPFTTHFKGPFRTHQRVHEKRESTREYTCKVAGCSAVFTSWDDYRRHGPVAHKRFICDTCGLKCSALGVLKDHKARHLNKQEHICSYCQRGHNTITDLRKHIQVYHLGVANYLCDTCGLAFRKKATRDEHQLGHSDVYAFACKMCDKKFKKKPQLQKHINIIHEKVRIPCPHCEKQFPTQYLLNSHIECAHNIQTRFTCDVCVATFRSQETLDSHRARHDNPHDLECARCLILFPSQEQLGDHLCITYRDDYVCCGRDLRYHGMYNRHMQLEHGITTNARVKPVPGALMAKMIAQRKRIETCPKCKQTFATRTLKKQHVESCMGSAEQNDGDNYGDGDVNPSSSFKM